MAGRRGGRGGAGRGISFNIENLGFGRGEALPGPILQPPPLFPPLEQKPVPLLAGEEGDYLLALKQEYQGSMKESVYFLKELHKKKDIERYSDKYQLGQGEEHWEPGGTGRETLGARWDRERNTGSQVGQGEEHWEPVERGEEHREPGGTGKGTLGAGLVRERNTGSHVGLGKKHWEPGWSGRGILGARWDWERNAGSQVGQGETHWEPGGTGRETLGARWDWERNTGSQVGQGEKHWKPDWSRIPAELRVHTKSKRRKTAAMPSVPSLDVNKTVDVDITKQLEVLEKKEGETSDKEDAAEDENADNEELEEFYDEEEMEEETDYNLTYFDNGEIDDDDDDMDDGPVY
ncbi:hypothetical protein LSAT2_025087 [Lamellibrachia satsuma]|nr:hypothetical protein LSAT2_025087 [Lamellibrachia satsuma]